MLPSWVIRPWLAGLAIAGCFAFSEGGVGEFFRDAFWQLAGVGLTAGLIDYLATRERRIRERPLRSVALIRMSQMYLQFGGLWRDMVNASDGDFTSNYFSPRGADTISRLRMDAPANVIPLQNWRGAMQSRRADIIAGFESIYGRGLQAYCSPELGRALDDLERSQFFRGIESTRYVSQKDGAFGWGHGTMGLGTLDAMARCRRLLIEETEAHLSQTEDYRLADILALLRHSPAPELS